MENLRGDLRGAGDGKRNLHTLGGINAGAERRVVGTEKDGILTGEKKEKRDRFGSQDGGEALRADYDSMRRLKGLEAPARQQPTTRRTPDLAGYPGRLCL